MDIGRSIQYVFQDPDWIKKVLIGGLLFFVPIIGWMLIGGYYIRTVQNVIRGADVPLPEWGDWGGDLVRGLKVLVVAIIWLIPVWLLTCMMIIIAGIDETGAMGLLFNCVIFIVSIAITFLMPLIISRLAVREEIGDAFQVGDIIQEAQRIPAQLLIYVVLSYAVGFVSNLGLILCVVGVVFTYFIGYLVLAHLIGQIRTMLSDGAPSGPVTEPPHPAV